MTRRILPKTNDKKTAFRWFCLSIILNVNYTYINRYVVICRSTIPSTYIVRLLNIIYINIYDIPTYQYLNSLYSPISMFMMLISPNITYLNPTFSSPCNRNSIAAALRHRVPMPPQRRRDHRLVVGQRNLAITWRFFFGQKKPANHKLLLFLIFFEKKKKTNHPQTNVMMLARKTGDFSNDWNCWRSEMKTCTTKIAGKYVIYGETC